MHNDDEDTSFFNEKKKTFVYKDKNLITLKVLIKYFISSFVIIQFN